MVFIFIIFKKPRKYPVSNYQRIWTLLIFYHHILLFSNVLVRDIHLSIFISSEKSLLRDLMVLPQHELTSIHLKTYEIRHQPHEVCSIIRVMLTTGWLALWDWRVTEKKSKGEFFWSCCLGKKALHPENEISKYIDNSNLVILSVSTGAILSAHDWKE